MKDNAKALTHVGVLIEGLNEVLSSPIKVEGTAYFSYTYLVKVSVGDQLSKIDFDRSIIEDLEVALEKYQGTKYLATLESSIKFRVYIELGQQGLLGNFRISIELIRDARDWIKNYQVDTTFSQEMTETILEGLNRLSDFFESQISRHKSLKLDSRQIEENRQWVRNLLDYHEKHGHLSSQGVGIRSLQFLKAAAIMQISELERLRECEKMRTTWRALNQKIYEIAISLRRDPFLDVEPPEFVHDLVVE